MTAGVRHLWKTTVLRQMLIACLLVIVPFGFYETLIFAIVGNGLHRPPTFLGVLATVQGFGAIAGGLTAGAIMKRTKEGALFGLGCALLAGMFLLVIPAWLPGVIVASAVEGASVPWILVGLYTLTQRRTPLDIQGRVYSAFDSLLGVPQTVSIAAGAGLVALVDYRLLLVVAAVMSGLAALYLMTRKEQWQPSPNDGAPSAVAPAYVDHGKPINLPLA